MYQYFKVAIAALLVAAPLSFVKAADCADDPKTTGLSRIIAIDASKVKHVGRLQFKKNNMLRKKEVILTFDDGPQHTHTQEILDVLDEHCVKATFFTVGRMAFFMKSQLKDIAGRGHTIASHTWSHPRDLTKMPLEEAKVEIEKGFAASAYVLGSPIAPFFRYPGLNYSDELNAYLSNRGISVWSVDVVSDDTKAGMTPETLVNQTMERLRRMRGGIVLFHDIKEVTALSMDAFLTQLKLEGFKIIHVVSNTAYQPAPDLVAQLEFSKQTLRTVAFTGVAPAGKSDDNEAIMTSGSIDFMKNEFVRLESEEQTAATN